MFKTIHRYREDANYKKLRHLLKNYNQEFVDSLYLAPNIEVLEERTNQVEPRLRGTVWALCR